MKRSLPTLLALALAAAACGGGDEATTATTVAPTEASSTTAAPTTEAPTTEAPTTTVAEVEEVSELSGVGTDYCNASMEAEVLNEAWNPTDPESTEITLTRTVELLSSVEPPAEIADTFFRFRDGYFELVDAAFDADYNMLAIPEDLPILNDPTMDQAADDLEDFDEFYCGAQDVENDIVIEEADGEAAGDIDELLDGADNDAMVELLQTEIGRKAFIDEMISDGSVDLSEAQATCMVDTLDGDLLAALLAAAEGAEPSDDDAFAFLAVLQDCDIPLSAFSG